MYTVAVENEVKLKIQEVEVIALLDTESHIIIVMLQFPTINNIQMGKSK